MVLPDPGQWPWWVWLLHVVGAAYLAGFVAAWIVFERLERAAVAGDAAALARFNRLVRRFPTAFFAKMCGKRPLRAIPNDRREPGR